MIVRKGGKLKSELLPKNELEVSALTEQDSNFKELFDRWTLKPLFGAFPQRISCFRVVFRKLLTILRKGYAGGSKTLPKQANTIEDTAMQQKALKKTHSSELW